VDAEECKGSSDSSKNAGEATSTPKYTPQFGPGAATSMTSMPGTNVPQSRSAPGASGSEPVPGSSNNRNEENEVSVGHQLLLKKGTIFAGVDFLRQKFSLATYTLELVLYCILQQVF